MDNEIINVENINTEVSESLDSKAEDVIKDEVAERKNEIKKEDHKKVGLFTLIVALSGVLGFVIGAIFITIMETMDEGGMTFLEFWNQLQKDFALPASFLLVVLDVIFILISFLYLRKAKKLWNSEMDEDEKYEVVDRKLSVSILITNINYFINFAFFGFSFYAVMSFGEDNSLNWLENNIRTISLVVFCATLFICLAIQKACVNHTKLMNPEKKGSIYDMKFDKVWYASCDEAERMQIGIASYKAFRYVNNTLIALLTIFVVAGMFFEIGILPIAVVTVVGLVNNITYGVESIKLGINSSGSKIS